RELDQAGVLEPARAALAAGAKVRDLGHGGVEDPLRRRVADPVHRRPDLLGAFDALPGHALLDADPQAVLAIQIRQALAQGIASSSLERAQLAEQQRGRDAVLVADEVAGAVTERLLVTEDVVEALLLHQLQRRGPD